LRRPGSDFRKLAVVELLPSPVEFNRMGHPFGNGRVIFERRVPHRQTREKFCGGIGHRIGRGQMRARHERAKKVQ
jgi:hypothetical protein